MIAKLTGRVDSLAAGYAVIDVNGVGYLVHCSSRTLSGLQTGETVALFIETVVREDRIELFGFSEYPEQEWFRLLTSVQGVGARVGLAVLSAFPTEDLMQAIAAGDGAAITRADGVGRKLAARIVGELKDKVGDLPAMGAAGAETAMTGSPAEAVSALIHLGYRRSEAVAAVGRAARRVGPDSPVNELIPEALKELAA